MQAGANAGVSVRKNETKLGEKYAALADIPFIDSVMLRTPMILHPRSNKRTGMFTERKDNPIQEFTGDADTWFCYPCKIGSLLAFIYFHRDFFASAVSLGNLFELANREECTQKPDLICLFGNAHIFVDDADAAFSGDGNGHSRFRHCIHCGRNNRRIQPNILG